MSKISKMVEDMSAKSPEFAAEYKKANERLEIAVALMELREANGWSQRQLAEKVGKPQSTIARIENGTMNASFNLLAEIARGVDKTLEVRFV